VVPMRNENGKNEQTYKQIIDILSEIVKDKVTLKKSQEADKNE
jgi:hypothetical protein